VAMRSFSTEHPQIEDDKPDQHKTTWKDWVTPSGLRGQYNRRKGSFYTYATIGVVGISIYYVIKGGFAIADFFVTTNFYDVATISFAAGMVTTGVVAVMLAYTRKLFIIRPEIVYQSVLAKVKSDQRVVTMLETTSPQVNFVHIH